ncbi:hypothetical protein Q5P01_015801 [Channa striata]|uniref:TLDc domain-containing protein n=1 Tax=Channa striata TaxID=64152 RepID=A0AA88SJ48_CHASR|nr:hypothetical protein Q5P01_015801 [Channa striata]
MDPRLTLQQQRKICSQLGTVKLQLLYKASLHGFTVAAFHQRCDNRCPTVSVGYNSSGYVFGGYTQKPFNQSGEFVNDDQAFLFTIKEEKLIKYPVSTPANAVKMVNNSGPYFGESFVLLNSGQAVIYSNPGYYYNFDAEEMHGNNLNLSECEVYQVETKLEIEAPWRTIIWEPEQKEKLMDSIKNYKFAYSSVSQARILLLGPVGAGKSSFINSVNSVFRGHVTNLTIAGSSTQSLTTQFRSYSLKADRSGKALPIVLCDTMGLEEKMGAGTYMDDLVDILKGHMPDGYQFNPIAPLHSGTADNKTSSHEKDRIHCVTYVLDACKIPIMPAKMQETFEIVRKKVNLMGIPQLILLTKVEEACSLVKEDLTKVYKSDYIRVLMHEASSQLGMPLSCVVPVKNYCDELELEMNCDLLLLSTVIQMLRVADDYFDNISYLVSNMEPRN